MNQDNKIVKIKDVIANQIPEFILSDNPNFSEFLKQYYTSQEFQGASVDIAENLINYKNVDAFDNKNLYSDTVLIKDVNFFDDEIYVDSVDGYPNEYGLIKIDNEIITYTGLDRGIISNTAKIAVGSTIAVFYDSPISSDYIGRKFKIKHYIEDLSGNQIQDPIIVGIITSANSVILSSVGIASTSVVGYNTTSKYDYEITLPKFTGCIRGFSGIDSLQQENNPEHLNFSSSNTDEHSKNSKVTNLSSLFLKEFFKKIKYQFIPGFEEVEFDSKVNVPNFISKARSFYQLKGTDDCYKILFKLLYNEDVKIIKPDDFTFKPSDDKWTICESFLCELISGDPFSLDGQTLYQDENQDKTILFASGSIYSIDEFYLKNQTCYKINLFSGYSNNLNSNGSIFGDFVETPITYVIEDITSGSNVVTVDSTIGFKNQGSIIINDFEIFYTDKTTNQFLNCSGISQNIFSKTKVYGNNYVYGYEKQSNNQVKLRILRSLSGIESSNNLYAIEGDPVKVDNLGNFEDNVFTRSLKYNLPLTVYSGKLKSSLETYDLEGVSLSNGNVRTLYDHKLKNNDLVDLYRTNFNQKIKSNVTVSVSNSNFKQYNIDVSGISSYIGSKITAKRKVFKSSSSNYPEINQKFTANIQNSFTDSQYNYITSNGFPNYTINPYERESTFTLSTSDFQTFTGTHNFYDGELVTIKNFQIYGNYSNLVGVDTGVSFYVKRIDNLNIKLSYSGQNVGLSSFITFNELTNPPYDNSISGFVNSLTLIDNKLYGNNLTSSKLFKKFPKIQKFSQEEQITFPGSLGVLVNGVEIKNYKSYDKIYYGKIESIDVLNQGENYDLLNPPRFKINSGLDTTTTLIPQMIGKITDLIVVDSGFNYNDTPVVTISGGGNDSVKTEVKMKLKANEIEFNASSNAGYVSDSEDKFIFPKKHNIVTGEEIIYQTLGGTSIGIGNFQNEILINNGLYYAINVGAGTSLRLAYTKDDAINNKYITIRQYGSGTQRFVSVNKKLVIDSVNLIDVNTEFKYKKIFCDYKGVNSYDNIITIQNHGFFQNDEIRFSFSGTILSGISTEINYYVHKIDESRFKLKTSKTSTSYLNIGSPDINSVYYFEYSPITVKISGGLVKDNNNNTIGSNSVIKPIVLGKIVDVKVSSFGYSNYGFETIFNSKNSPYIEELTGSGANLDPFVVDGKIKQVLIKNSGLNYFNSIKLIVTGSGYGAKLEPIITNGKITSVIVVNEGVGYDSLTKIKVLEVGKNLKISGNLQYWSVNEVSKYGLSASNGTLFGKKDSPFGNTFGIFYFGNNLLTEFNIPTLSSNQNPLSHSPIVGWSYDGCPIYGPDAYTNVDGTGGFRRMTSSYRLKTNVSNQRPTTEIYPLGFFIEDYEYVEGLGTLDKHNGRYCVTPEFPNGVYAYFCSISKNRAQQFPYIVGNSYKFTPEKDNFNLKINQDLNFNSLNIVKHTLPYGVENKEYYYEYFNFNQKSKYGEILVTNTSRGKVDDIIVVNGGSGYSIGNEISFDNSNTGGFGALARVSELSGVGINSINPSSQTIQNVTLQYKNNSVIGISTEPHNLKSGNYVNITGISSSNFSNLEGFVKINVTTKDTNLLQFLSDQSITGIVTSIKIKGSILDYEIDSFIKIETETLKIIGLDLINNSINVLRELGATSKSSGSLVKFLQNNFSFEYPKPISLPEKNEVYYFNPYQSVSVGLSTGVGIGNTLSILPLGPGISNTQFTLTGRIFLPNHKFKHGEKVVYTPDQNPIGFSNSDYLNSLDSLYVVKIDQNTIGLTSSRSSINDPNSLLLYRPGTVENSHLHKLTTDRNIVTCNAITSNVIVSTTQPHELSVNDQISLNVISGVTTTYIVSYDSFNGKLKIDSQNNPAINSYNNETIVFDLTSFTLSETKFKLYTDSNFVNEYLGNEKNGIEVIKTDISLTLSISDYTPKVLYYNIESSTKDVFSDESVFNFNKIIINSSLYNNIISGITSTTSLSFNVNYPFYLENRSYDLNNSKILYNIIKSNVSGSISKVSLISKGNNYKKLPKISNISGNGSNCNLIPISNSIGKILNHSVVNSEFVLPSDKTLNPFSNSYSSVFLYNNYKVESLSIISRGGNYLSAPKINLYSKNSNKLITDFSANVTMKDGCLDAVQIINPSSGLVSTDNKIVFTKNDNGLKILGLNYTINSSGALVTLTLQTPPTGFSTSNPLPFIAGDKIFVEGIYSIGNGYNSSDYNYNLFDVVNIQPAYGSQDAAQIRYQISKSPGIFILNTTLQNNAYVVNSKFLPEVSANLTENIFYGGEVVKDSTIIENSKNDPITNLLKVNSPNTIEVNDIIVGKNSNSKGKVSKKETYDLILRSSESVPQAMGWKTQHGNLSTIVQKLPDNDYYQKFSYSLKSKKSISDWNSIVSDTSHVSGYKKFGDLIVESTSQNNLSVGSSSLTQINISLSSEADICTVNDFDLVLENVEDYNYKYSDIIKFNSKILTDYLLSKENLVLSVDDISNLFDTDIPTIPVIPVDVVDGSIVVKYLFFVQSTESFFGDFVNPQFFELLLTRDNQIINLTSYSYYENINLGRIIANVIDNDSISVNYVPTSPFNSLLIRAIREDVNPNIGIVSTSYGYARNVAITTYYESEVSPSQKIIYSIPLSESSSGTLFLGISSHFNNIQSSSEMSFLYHNGNLDYDVYSSNEIVGLGTVGISTSGNNLIITYNGVSGIGVTVYSNITFLKNSLTSPNAITDTLTRLNSDMISGSYSSGTAVTSFSADYGASKFVLEVTKTVGLSTGKGLILIDSIHYSQDNYLKNINYSIIGDVKDLSFNTTYDQINNSYVLSYVPSSSANYTIKFFQKNILSIIL